MAQYMSQHARASDAFLYSRVGEQGKSMMDAARTRRNQPRPPASLRTYLSGLKARARQAFYTRLLGPLDVEALELGQFRLSSGQVSYRMYDRFSLKQLFSSAGLSSVAVTNADESRYPGWARVNLDVAPDGRPARPHALIMEGIRPD
jgi:hypothetical protein